MLFSGRSFFDDAELEPLNFEPDAFGSDHCLCHVGIEQKCREFLAAKSGCRVAASQVSDNALGKLLKRSAAGQVPVCIVDLFKMVKIHHENAKRPVFGLGATRL